MIDLLRLLSRVVAAGFSVTAALAHCQTGLLNDTGTTRCARTDNGGLVSCTVETLGNDGNLPHQDARHGRDVASPTKVGDGAAGFDFTRICWNGSPEGTTTGPNPCTGTLVANTAGAASSTPETDWACTRDNVTGLMWSLQTQSASWIAATGATYPDAGHNTPARCGAITAGSRWRMPSRHELLGIVHNGAATSPQIDTTYFPATLRYYLAAESYAVNPVNAWYVDFYFGGTSVATGGSVRLVRSVQ